MRITSEIARGLLGWILTISSVLAGVYIGIGWIPLCNRLALVGLIGAPILLLIASMRAVIDKDKENDNCDYEHLEIVAQYIRAYLECNEAEQRGIRHLLSILSDPETGEDRHMTLVALAEALRCDP